MREFMYTKYAELRDKKGFTDYKVCTLTGIAPTTMSDWKKRTENRKADDKVPYLSADKLQKIAQLFGVKIEDLI
jgi:transcriptional regulator with XRE-family HTH domain